jgi:hypothetical protein
MASDSEIRQWAQARGEPVSAKGRVGAAVRRLYDTAHGETVRRLPSPSEVGDLEPEDYAHIIDIDADDGSADVSSQASDPVASPGEAGPDAGPDEPPAHAGRDWQQETRTRAKPGKPPRITVGVRNDITAKLSFALEIPGRIWQARDPVCGTVFIDQRPEIAGALTNIVVDSPDLVAFFTGPGGKFMKYLELAAAAWPVVTVVMAHHVYHSIEDGSQEAGPEIYRQYAA